MNARTPANALSSSTHDVAPCQKDFFTQLQSMIKTLRQQMFSKYKRHVSVSDLLSDRWDTAKFYGFGEGTSCYNNVLILGEVSVGAHSWIGSNVILDGSGGLEIGDYVSVSSGVQIYTHHTVDWSISLGREPIRRLPTKIGNGAYIGPNSVIQMGIHIGDGAIIGAMSFVNCDVPAGSKYYGIPAKHIAT